MGTTLITLAHPDDDCLLCGTIAYLAQKGDRLVLYYATQGEAGLTGGLCEPEDLAVERYQELSHAMKTLGVSRVIVRDFGDGQLSSKQDLLVEDICTVLEQERPEKVITFPPSGITNHSDHQMTQRATLVAVQAYSGQTKLYYRVVPENSSGIVRVEHDAGIKITHQVHVAPYREQMYQAMKAHRSQQDPMSTIFPALTDNGGSWLLWPNEYFAAVVLT